jgi:hypothetical protein
MGRRTRRFNRIRFTAFAALMLYALWSSSHFAHNKAAIKRSRVVVVAPSRSQKSWRSINDATLHTILLPSLKKTISQNPHSHDVHVAVVVDAVDTFWQEQNIAKVMGEHALPISFLITRTHPGHIPFNEGCAVAYEYGAEYIVRVNDDSEFVSHRWLEMAILELMNFRPRHVGVVGPRCDEGNTHILTHDMVHRTHLDIFDTYYPSEFDNWWIDDWISSVYANNTRKLTSWHVRHHTTAYGSRYNVNKSQEALLQTLIPEGQHKIAKFLACDGHCMHTSRRAEIRRVVYIYGPMSSVIN